MINGESDICGGGGNKGECRELVVGDKVGDDIGGIWGLGRWEVGGIGSVCKVGGGKSKVGV